MEEANVSPDEAIQRDMETETPENQNEEEATSEQETSEDEVSQETSKQKPDAEQEKLEREHHDFKVRAQKAETKLKELKKRENIVREKVDFSSVDPLDLAKTVSVLKDYNSDELDYIQVVSKGKGISLEEAVITDEVKTYVEAKRQKANESNKIPSPSSSGSISVGDKTQDDIENMSSTEYSVFVKEQKEKAPVNRQGI